MFNNGLQKSEETFNFLDVETREIVASIDLEGAIRLLIRRLDLWTYETLKRRLRPDAKFWLLLNATYVVATPVLARFPLEVDSLLNVIQSDFETLIRSSAESTAKGKPITIHALINALPGMWDRLKASDWRLWERE